MSLTLTLTPLYSVLGGRSDVSPHHLPVLSVLSKQSCTDLLKEKEEACASSEEALRTLKERHKEELVQLEDRCATRTHKDTNIVSSLPTFAQREIPAETRRILVTLSTSKDSSHLLK